VGGFVRLFALVHVQLAALAIEHRATLLSIDREIEQFAGLCVKRVA